MGYWAGSLDSVDAPEDDLRASDALLATQFGTTAEEVAEFVEDGAGPFTTAADIVQTRAVLGADDGRDTTYIIAARAFVVLDTGLVASLECPSGVETSAKWAQLARDPAAFQLAFRAGG